MATSHRIFLQGRMGRQAINFNLSGVEITEPIGGSNVGSSGEHPGWNIQRPGVDTRLLVHGPDVWITNIVPHGSAAEAGGVEFMLHVDSSTPIDVAVTMTILEPLETNASTLL